MYNQTLYRGTTELWEKAVIESQLPSQNTSLITGQFMKRMARMDPNLENTIRNRLQGQPCSMLRSGKEIVRGFPPTPIMQLSATEINTEIVARVGVETAPGTPNLYSHFVPCGTNSGISNNFGHGAYYRFQMQGKIYGNTIQDINLYVNERNQLPAYVIPLFTGGNNEVLAYTGSLITSVVLMSGQNIQSVALNSLD